MENIINIKITININQQLQTRQIMMIRHIIKNIPFSIAITGSNQYIRYAKSSKTYKQILNIKQNTINNSFVDP